jgi:hypothetical protein
MLGSKTVTNLMIDEHQYFPESIEMDQEIVPSHSRLNKYHEHSCNS